MRWSSIVEVRLDLNLKIRGIVFDSPSQLKPLSLPYIAILKRVLRGRPNIVGRPLLFCKGVIWLFVKVERSENRYTIEKITREIAISLTELKLRYGI